MHGKSQAAPAPHTIVTAGADIHRLEAMLSTTVTAVAGHSFGGKVALQYATTRQTILAHTWVLDSDPAAKPAAQTHSSTLSPIAVLRTLDMLPTTFASRQAFIDAIVAHGYSRPFAQWLGMNLDRADGIYRIRLDPSAMRELLTSYFATDLWPAAFDYMTHGGDLHFVVGGESDSVSPASRALMERSPATYDVLHGAGHWLHVDALDALVTLITRQIGAV